MAKLTTTAVILAAGSGKRFFPFITPKPLIPFLGISLLERNLKQLAEWGIGRCLIITTKVDEPQIKALNFPPSMTVQTAVQPTPTGMAGALLAAATNITSQDSLFIINATDIVDSQAMKHLFNKQMSSNVPVIIGLNQAEYFPGGYIAADPNGQFQSVIEKPGPHKRPSNLIKLVFDYLPKGQDFLKVLARSQSTQDDIYEKALTRYARLNHARVLTYQGYWQSPKYPHHMLLISQTLLNQLPDKKPSKFSQASIQSPLSCGQNVTIHPGAIIKGPVYLGDNVVVGNHALIRDSMIEANSVIGSYSEIVRSYVGENCNLHRVYLGDSVLEKNVNMGAGSTTANWRFDQKPVQLDINQQKIDTNLVKCGAFIGQGTKIGINVSLMPGTLIGPNSTIMPASLAKGTIPPHTTVGSI
jgi:UDP-N-acetylglucosamine diphosphorylase / glucose-1-phosphate thymidylyltransferase / UDP-N-acetylgalactosamine diphosphorylase / glucosamine-1-phosphate N-acetyltransferase / galactosamine-1-phosphate N-acetyltransferase